MSDEKGSIGEETITEEDLDKIMRDIEGEDSGGDGESDASAKVEEALTAALESVPEPEEKQVKHFPAVSGVSGGKLAGPEGKNQSLTLEMNGSINLTLRFNSGGRSIEVFCTEEALICRMADGTEFRIPTAPGAEGKKKAA